MRIVLIGNYPPDRQQSMERFARMLEAGFKEAGHEVEVWRPCVWFGRVARSTSSGFGKWLGYVDKWLVFPLVLRWRRVTAGQSIYHVCDHSNAPYLAHLPPARTSITCHDVLAIRGALGHADAFCPASRFGKILQAWILGNLAKATRLAAVSEFTLNQLKELAPKQSQRADWRVIHNAYNGNFSPMDRDGAVKHLEKVGLRGDTPFLLHVGSDLPRKNRSLLLKMAAALGEGWAGSLCFAGRPMNPIMKREAAGLGLTDRIIEVVGPEHETLVALYSRCEAFVFPSYSEGFGWPVIEAQACGAPVLASENAPMPEVSGGAAIHLAPDDAQGFADGLLKLGDPSVRSELIQAGFENAKRFTPQRMIDAYLNLMAR